jgi:hypothetical protein
MHFRPVFRTWDYSINDYTSTQKSGNSFMSYECYYLVAAERVLNRVLWENGIENGCTAFRKNGTVKHFNTTA